MPCHVMNTGSGVTPASLSRMGCFSPTKDDIVSTIAQSLKASYENSNAQNQDQGLNGDSWNGDEAEREAAQSLVLLGTSPEPPKQHAAMLHTDEDLAIDGLLHLRELLPHEATDLLCKPCTSSSGWDLGVGDMPDLGDMQLSQIIGNFEDADIDAPANKTPPHGNDLLAPALLESPSKAGQLLHNLNVMYSRATSVERNVSMENLTQPVRCHSLPSAVCQKAAEQMRSIRKCRRTQSVSPKQTLPIAHFSEPSTSKKTAKNCVVSAPKTVTVAGTTLPAVTSPQLDASTSYVLISDVFKTFFSKRHWDQFKTILEKNNVESLSVPVMHGNCIDNCQVMSEEHLKMLLLENEARKEGFVRCTQIGTDDQGRLVKHDSLMVAPSESIPGELSSGIRTRNSLQSDIGYVQVDGFTLPCIASKYCEQYVRLADIQSIVFNNLNGNCANNKAVTPSQVRALKAMCLRLGVLVRKCSLNEKSRLVVVANSAYSNSLHVLPVSELPNLIAYLKSGAYLKRPHSPESVVPRKRPFQLPGCDSSSEAGESWDGDSVTSSTYSAISNQHSSDTTLKSSYRDTPGHSSVELPKLAIKLKNDGDGNFKVEQAIIEPPINNIHELLQHTTPCSVDLHKSAFLVVAVSNWSGCRGPMGRYWDYLFQCTHAECIECVVCHKFMSVTNFLHHSSYHHIHVPHPRIFTLSSNTKLEHERFTLWESLQRKLVKYGLCELSYTLPANLVTYYMQRSNDQLQRPTTRKGVVYCLKQINSNVNRQSQQANHNSLLRNWLRDERLATLPSNLIDRNALPPAGLDPVLQAVRKSLPPSKPRAPIQTSALELAYRRRVTESQHLPNTWAVGEKSKDKEDLISFWYDRTS